MTNDPAPATLDGVLAMALDALARAVEDRASPFHVPTLASIGRDGAPSLRSVILRGFDAPSRTLAIHTDRRSSKAAEIAADPRVMLHGHDPALRMQLRVAGVATLHLDDAIADAAWATSRETSRMTYATAHPPGTTLPAPPAAPRDAVAGRGNFAALLLRIDSLDCLQIDPAGHRRARFTWGPDGALVATWLAP